MVGRAAFEGTFGGVLIEKVTPAATRATIVAERSAKAASPHGRLLRVVDGWVLPVALSWVFLARRKWWLLSLACFPSRAAGTGKHAAGTVRSL